MELISFVRSAAYKRMLMLLVGVGLLCFCNTASSASPDGRVGDSGKCGRDCAFYIANKLGVDAKLDVLDDQLGGAFGCSMADLQRVFEDSGLHCKSYQFEPRHRDLLSSLARNQGLCILGALSDARIPNETGMRHFVVVLPSDPTVLRAYDPAVNTIRSIPFEEIDRKQSSMPVLLVSTDSRFPSLALTRAQLTIKRIVAPPYAAISLILVEIVCILYVCTLWRRRRRTERSTKSRKASVWLARRGRRWPLWSAAFVVACVVCAVMAVKLWNGKAGESSALSVFPPSVDLGESVLGTLREFRLTVENTTATEIDIRDVKTSCGCLNPVDWPRRLPAHSSGSFQFRITPQTDGEKLYKVLILPRSENANPVVAEVRSVGVRKSKFVPLRLMVGSFSDNCAEKVVNYQFVNPGGCPFVLEKLSMTHPNSRLSVHCEQVGPIEDGEAIAVTLTYKGESSCGSWQDGILFYGREMDSGSPLVFVCDISGAVTCSRCAGGVLSSAITKSLDERPPQSTGAGL